MRVWILGLVLLGALRLSGAQETGTGGLSHGMLTAWIVGPPVNQGATLRKIVTADTYHEETAGSFGSTWAEVTAKAARLNGPASSGPPSSPGRERDRGWDAMEQQLRHSFEGLNLRLVDVGSDELKTRFSAASGTGEMPDVLLGKQADLYGTAEEVAFQRHVGLRLSDEPVAIAQNEAGVVVGRRFGRDLDPIVTILQLALHPEAARSFAIWLRRIPACLPCGAVSPEADAAGATASEVLQEVLAGGTVGAEADPEMAPFPAGAGLLLGGKSDRSGAPARLRVDVLSATANERFAVVRLRALAEDAAEFGVVEALVVLRTNKAGDWKVLQISPKLRGQDAEFASDALRKYTGKEREAAEVLGIAQASPLDGDRREAMPALWWDNKGGATMQVVEWQSGARDAWGVSNLFFVPDANAKLRTEVKGRFAALGGGYRWRVWSVGAGGVVVLSGWRGLEILR